MITIISPAKSLDFETPSPVSFYSQPEFIEEAERINQYLKRLNVSGLIKLMGISAKLATLNVERNLQWSTPFTPQNAKQAIFAFNGDVYEGMNASVFSEEEVKLAQERIRIISGLYGLLKPLDLIQPYRLEMGTKLEIGSAKDLYGFWKEKITARLNEDVKKNGSVLINLASAEYYKAIDFSRVEGRIITPEFKDNKNGKYIIISFFAKKARGLMNRFIIQNKLTKPEDLKAFDLDGYYYNNQLSKGDKWVFTRER
ncbi:peroxide stress protein YaaA [Gaoshiqia sp. Z1-71]|uniref:peroxide stress protein YaaA n=1 Tax=Gaoshiqia hydrogeniformans TaxID=3290090 RepID=UPI003BF8DAA2